MKTNFFAAALAATIILASGSAAAVELRIGMQEEPDALDPDQGGTYAGRVVFAALFEKLIDIDRNLNFVPQLATAWSWSSDKLALTLELRRGVKFHDGSPFNAAAVKFNIERSKTLPESRRKAEFSLITSVDIVDEWAVRLNLRRPFAPLIATLADRAGMMVSPQAASAGDGAAFARKPVGTGPFRFIERIAQERIVVGKFAPYWNPAAIKLDKVVYLMTPDAAVRLAILRSGGIDIMQRVAPTDLKQVRDDPKLRLLSTVGLGFSALSINVGNGARSNTPLGGNAKVRRALELAIDRYIINKVVYDGAYLTGNQPVVPASPYYIKSLPIRRGDPRAARALLREAGFDRLSFKLMVANTTGDRQVAQVIQAMVKEAGFDVGLEALEETTAVNNWIAGNYDVFLFNWSGRADPDGNIFPFFSCSGHQNNGKYCDPLVERLLTEARAVGDLAARYRLYEQAAEIYMAALPHITLYHANWFWGVTRRLSGFTPYPDGIVRLGGVTLN